MRPLALMRFNALILLLFLTGARSAFVIAQTPQPRPSATDIAELIEGLGSEDFLFRQRSNEQLMQAGSAAIGPLEAAKSSPDPEVRYRVNEILKKLLEQNVEERAARFLSLPPTSTDDCGFEHWETFSSFAGKTREARSLLVAILGDPTSAKLLQSIAPSETSAAGTSTSTKLLHDQSVTASVVVFAAQMYRELMQPKSAAPDQEAKLTGSGVVEELSASAFESQFLSLPPLTVQQSAHKTPFVILLRTWLKSELKTSPMTVAKLKIISAYRLRDFADYLTVLLNQPQYPHKQAAIESLSKLFLSHEEAEPNSAVKSSGVDDAISHLKPFVFADEVLVRLPQSESTGPLDVTLGDFAFQLILSIQEKAPKDFGMCEGNGKMLLGSNSVFCFEDREKAAESIKRWQAGFHSPNSNTDYNSDRN